MAKDMVATVTEQQKSKKRKDKLPRTTPPPLSPPPPPKKTPVGRVHKQTAKQASIVASNATAKSLFAETDQLRKLQEEVTMLRNQLDRKDQVLPYTSKHSRGKTFAVFADFSKTRKFYH